MTAVTAECGLCGAPIPPGTRYGDHWDVCPGRSWEDRHGDIPSTDG